MQQIKSYLSTKKHICSIVNWWLTSLCVCALCNAHKRTRDQFFAIASNQQLNKNKKSEWLDDNGWKKQNCEHNSKNTEYDGNVQTLLGSHTGYVRAKNNNLFYSITIINMCYRCRNGMIMSLSLFLFVDVFYAQVIWMRAASHVPKKCLFCCFSPYLKFSLSSFLLVYYDGFTQFFPYWDYMAPNICSYRRQRQNRYSQWICVVCIACVCCTIYVTANNSIKIWRQSEEKCQWMERSGPKRKQMKKQKIRNEHRTEEIKEEKKNGRAPSM